MTVLANLIVAGVNDARTTLEGKTLTEPALMYTDGVNVTYCVDVDIGREGVINDNGDLGMLPLYGVPIAAGNHSLFYAAVGSAVTLSKNATGQWQVTGFAKTYPGTFTTLCITAPEYCLRIPSVTEAGDPAYHEPVIGEPIRIDEEVRQLTYGEIATYGSYGVTCYGALLRLVGGVPTEVICSGIPVPVS